jgi:hypothetical protein
MSVGAEGSCTDRGSCTVTGNASGTLAGVKLSDSAKTTCTASGCGAPTNEVTVGTDVPGVNVSQHIGGDGKTEVSGPLGPENSSNTAGQSNSGTPSTTSVGATGYVDYTVSHSITWSQIGAGIRSLPGMSPAPAPSTSQ